MDGKKVLKEMAPYRQGMQIDEVKEQYGLSHIVKLASNENPFGYSNNVAGAMNITNDFMRYPDGHATKLRNKLSQKLAVRAEQLVFGSGSDELIQLICRTFLTDGDNVIMATPTFSQYKHHAHIEGVDIMEVPTVNGYHDLVGMKKRINKQTKIIFLCSPNNPTGCVIPKEELYTFMDDCPKNVLIILDEAYFEYMDPSNDPNMISNIDSYENVLVLRTFSKAYGLAGLRVGYGVGHQHIINQLNVVRGPFNTSSIAQTAAILALDDEAFIMDTYTRNRKNKLDFTHFLDDLGWKYYDSETNFVLIQLPVTGNDMYQYLVKHGFIVRSGDGIGVPNTIRVTIGTKENMEELKAILQKFSHEVVGALGEK